MAENKFYGDNATQEMRQVAEDLGIRLSGTESFCSSPTADSDY